MKWFDRIVLVTIARLAIRERVLVSFLLATAAVTGPLVAQDSGAVYTAAQAAAGHDLYVESCARCHGADLSDGSAPPLTGPTFRRTWSRENANVADLLYVMVNSMPPRGAGMLDEEEQVSILAYIMSRNGLAAGSVPLGTDDETLGSISLISEEDKRTAAALEFIPGERTTPLGVGPSSADLLAAATDSANWPYHTRDYAGTRYSPLGQITTDNVGDLAPTCLYQLGEERNFQTGPVVFDGVMYITGVRTTAAIEANTCRPIWRYVWEPRDREVWLNNRGVAIQDGYVVRGTSDGYLLALDAADGSLIWARQVADPWTGETFTMAPLVYDGTVFIGPAGSENAISGWVGAFRLSDGDELWRFQTVPGATRAGGESWGNPLGIPIGGGATWTPFSLDPDRGELYVAVTNPAPDLPAHLRPGPNLYTNSIVALDVGTGEVLWYDQLVPEDDHDWDVTQVSPIYRQAVDGQMRNLVATAGKDGMLRAIDRDRKRRVFEAAVTTRENVAAPVTAEGTKACPGVLGGVEWNGPAWHPATQTLITPAVDWCFVFRAFENEDVRYVEGQTYLGGEVEPAGPRTGWLTSVDAGTGELRWKYHSDDAVVGAVTTTGGGLVFAGELTGDFIALDAASGEVLYRFNTGGPIGGGVVSYAVEGRQYVAVASGRPSGFWWGDNPGSGTVVVFSLR
jgi:alcohol dehydrogenase (cytochrome c)